MIGLISSSPRLPPSRRMQIRRDALRGFSPGVLRTPARPFVARAPRRFDNARRFSHDRHHRFAVTRFLRRRADYVDSTEPVAHSFRRAISGCSPTPSMRFRLSREISSVISTERIASFVRRLQPYAADIDTDFTVSPRFTMSRGHDYATKAHSILYRHLCSADAFRFSDGESRR